MATSYKVLGQLESTASLVALYTAGAGVQTIVSTILVCNRAATAKTYSIVLRPNNETLANKHYLVSGATIDANSTTTYTLGITCDASDVIYVSASDTNVSFSAFGTEIA
jgi:hypothetical protein